MLHAGGLPPFYRMCRVSGPELFAFVAGGKEGIEDRLTVKGGKVNIVNLWDVWEQTGQYDERHGCVCCKLGDVTGVRPAAAGPLYCTVCALAVPQLPRHGKLVTPTA